MCILRRHARVMRGNGVHHVDILQNAHVQHVQWVWLPMCITCWAEGQTRQSRTAGGPWAWQVLRTPIEGRRILVAKNSEH